MGQAPLSHCVACAPRAWGWAAQRAPLLVSGRGNQRKLRACGHHHSAPLPPHRSSPGTPVPAVRRRLLPSRHPHSGLFWSFDFSLPLPPGRAAPAFLLPTLPTRPQKTPQARRSPSPPRWCTLPCRHGPSLWGHERLVCSLVWTMSWTQEG